MRLGRREAALELLRFFFSDRRPPPWNQWPEIAWRDRKAPAHVGDLPHTWISAEYVLAVRSLFAYELESRRTLVLAAGLSPEWLEGAGVEVKAMPTLYGALSYSLRRVDARTLRFDIAARSTRRLILRPPLGARAAQCAVNGSAVVPAADDSIADRANAGGSDLRLLLSRPRYPRSLNRGTVPGVTEARHPDVQRLGERDRPHRLAASSRLADPRDLRLACRQILW